MASAGAGALRQINPDERETEAGIGMVAASLLTVPAMTDTLTTIGFDADDTLWQNEHFYRLTEDALPRPSRRRMASARPCRRGCSRRRSATSPLYGFGIKGFTLSMIETAIEVTEGRGLRPR